MTDAQARHQDLGYEMIRGHGGHTGVELQLVKVVDPQLGQPMRLCLGIHQAKGRGLRDKVAARMRLEGDNAQGAVQFCRGGMGQ